MPVNADSVVVELIAKTDGYAAAVNGAAAATTNAMSRIEQSASRAEGQIVTSTRAMANAQRNLGRQVADIGTQLSGGQSPFLIIAQQAPQVADALADTGGKAASVAAFFAGPFGAALLAAGSLLGVLASKALQGGESVADLTKKLADNAEKTRNADAAQAAFAQTTAGLAIALKDTAKALDQENASSQRSTFVTLAKAEADRQATIQARRRAVATLAVAVAEAQRADFQGATNVGSAGAATAAGGGALVATGRLEAAQRELAKATQNVAQAESNVVRARAPIIRQQIAEGLDAATRATGRYERSLDLLYSKLRRGQITEAQYATQVRQATQRRDEVLNAPRSSGRAGAGGRGGGTSRVSAETSDIDLTARLVDAIRRDLLEITRSTSSLIKPEAERLREASQRFKEVFGDQPDAIGEGVSAYEREARDEIDARTAAEQRVQGVREDNVRSLAYLYEDLFQQGTDGLWQNFKDQGLRTLAIVLAQASVASFGAGGGGFGSLLGNIGKGFSGGNSLASLFGRASGGYVGPGQTVRVNEGSGRAELLRMGPQGGTVIPLGQQTAAAPARGGTTVMQTIQVDARGAVMNDQFASQILARAQRDAGQIVKANNAGIRAALPGQLDRYGKLGTTG